MIDEKQLRQVVETFLQDEKCYLVDLRVSPNNDIVIEIDSDTDVDIDRCIALTREIESHFDREKEDYQLEVGSAGLTSPLKITRQYLKNIGNEMELLTRDGKKWRGILTAADDATCTLEIEVTEKPEGAKRKVKTKRNFIFERENIKYIKQIITFK